MKASRSIAIAALAFLAACTSTPAPFPSPTPSQSPTRPSPTATPTTPAAIGANQIVYTISDRETPDRSRWGDIYLYEVATDRVTRLTFDGERVSETVPRFRGELITFIADRRDLVQLDPETHARRRLLQAAAHLVTYAWSPDRNEVVYLETLSSGAHRLRVFNAKTRATATLKNLGTPDGRGTTDFDAVTIDWNRAGDRILLSDSYLDGGRTIRLIRRPDGADIITPIRQATNAIWSADETSIFLLDLAPAVNDGDPVWRRLDVATQTMRRLGLRAGSFHALLSPDGTRLAATTYDRDTQAQAVWVLDLRTGKQTRVVRGYRDALWLDNDRLALTRVIPCTAGTTCEYYGYRATGTRRVALDGSVSRLRLGSTMWDGLGKPGDVSYVTAA
ncbi:MAG: hypothetical protein WAT66_00080 [Actinomycetota bacterium]